MHTLAAAAVIPSEFKTDYVLLPADESLEVTVENTFYQEGADCVDVRCLYPTGIVRVHQLFLNDKIDKLITYMINSFRGVYNEAVVPLAPLPTMQTLNNYVIKFKKG